MRLVLDTDILVASFRSRTGASAELVRQARHNRYTLIMTVPLMLEYEAVTTRADHLAAAGLSAAEVNKALDVLADVASLTYVGFSYRPATADPDDEFVLEAAVNGRADAIVTFNRRDFGDAPSRFGVACLLPRQALEKLR